MELEQIDRIMQHLINRGRAPPGITESSTIWFLLIFFLCFHFAGISLSVYKGNDYILTLDYKIHSSFQLFFSPFYSCSYNFRDFFLLQDDYCMKSLDADYKFYYHLEVC
jgi:hypothetical protein